ncbi:pancreatic lipase-related protein 2-like [Ixodes scapularis]|uniref:pancreatic lipase-related protein 2-like n=1 Tax=Ixodes scapularis TaxID=6945 RepID=UPI001C386983|nr:pancreatic lipase-related protein 2-like [Ixodes scapularis]
MYKLALKPVPKYYPVEFRKDPETSSRSKQTLEGSFTRFLGAFLELLEGVLPGNFWGAIFPKIVDSSGDYVCYAYVGCFTSDDGLTLPTCLPDDPDKVKTAFLLYSRSNRQSPVTLDYKSGCANTTLTQFDIRRPLVIVVHGWLRNSNTAYLPETKDALLEKEDLNVILVDWRGGASQLNYIQSSGDTALVGRQISVLVQGLMKSYPDALKASDVHAIGHSLGAGVVGFFGKHFKNSTGTLIGRISALDAAAPLFADTSVYVSHRDAVFVDAIHTSGGNKTIFKEFGIYNPIGHVDFYVNGGRKQPGCSLFSLFCSHRGSLLYYLESLTNDHCNFTSTPCLGGLKALKKNQCIPGKEDLGQLGYYSIDAPGRGIQILDTNAEAEFCISYP